MNRDFSETPPWLLKRVAVTESTNDLARNLQAWQAVVAGRQISGRGRHRRRFVCAEGGIWLSAVVPMPGGPQRWTGLALAVGWGLLKWLQSLPNLAHEACEEARLRWPNDLMIGKKKLGGILLEQSSAESCIVGVGINITNDPADEDPNLLGVVTRLADWLPFCPPPLDFIPGVLEGIANGWARMEKQGLAGMMPDLNECWGGPREVEIRPLEGPPVFGTLWGIDEEGAIVIRLPEGGGRTFPAHQIERMIET
jgi:BirA family transcriptional regulator, biotin operon repressor / biotin---[acetyl-CoA-carboxylase] ligase